MDFAAHEGRRSFLRIARRTLAWALVLSLAGLQGYLGTWPPITRVTTDAMSPAIESGDFVALKRVETRVERGDIVMVAVPSDVQRERAYPSEILRRVVDVTSEGQLVLRGDNRDENEPFVVAPSSVRERLFAVVPVMDRVAEQVSSWLDDAEPILERVETGVRPVGEMIEPWAERLPLFPLAGVVLVLLLLFVLRDLRRRRRRPVLRAPRVDLLHPKLEWGSRDTKASVSRPAAAGGPSGDPTEEIVVRPRPPIFPRPIPAEDDLPLFPTSAGAEHPELEPSWDPARAVEASRSQAEFLAALEARPPEVVEHELDEHTRGLVEEVEGHLEHAASENAGMKDTVRELVGVIGEYGEHLRSHTAILQSMSAASADLANVVAALKQVLDRTPQDVAGLPKGDEPPAARTDVAPEGELERRSAARSSLTIRVHTVDAAPRPSSPASPPRWPPTAGPLRVRVHGHPPAPRPPTAATPLPAQVPSVGRVEQFSVSARPGTAPDAAAPPTRGRLSPTERALLAGRLLEWLYLHAHGGRASVRIDELAAHLGIEHVTAEATLGWLAIRGHVAVTAARPGELYVCEL